jgi:hypothetical protein
MSARAFSIRTPLQGELVEFTRSSGFECTHTDVLVRDLTCLLSSYREEDVPLFPEVFVLFSPTDVAGLAPGTTRIKIGEVGLDDKAASTILKNCASLAARGWAIYMAKVAEKRMEFGLFRAQRHSYSTAAAETRHSDPQPRTLGRGVEEF